VRVWARAKKSTDHRTWNVPTTQPATSLAISCNLSPWVAPLLFLINVYVLAFESSKKPSVRRVFVQSKQALWTKSEFLAEMDHEIRTHINALLVSHRKSWGVNHPLWVAMRSWPIDTNIATNMKSHGSYLGFFFPFCSSVISRVLDILRICWR